MHKRILCKAVSEERQVIVQVTLVEFAEKVSPVPLMNWQKQFLAAYEQAEKEGKRLVFIPTRCTGRNMLADIIGSYQELS